MIFLERPEQFAPRFEIVSCFLEADGNILLLQRHDNKSEGGRWGVPAGKIDFGENKIEAMVREMREETGLEILPEDLSFAQTVYVRNPEYDFIYHIFTLKLPSQPKITISDYEHQAYRWADPHQARSLNLVRDMKDCIDLHYQITIN